MNPEHEKHEKTIARHKIIKLLKTSGNKENVKNQSEKKDTLCPEEQRSGGRQISHQSNVLSIQSTERKKNTQQQNTINLEFYT